MMISRSEQLYLSGDQDVDLKVDTSNYGPNLVNLSDNTLDNIFEITDPKRVEVLQKWYSQEVPNSKPNTQIISLKIDLIIILTYRKSSIKPPRAYLSK